MKNKKNQSLIRRAFNLKVVIISVIALSASFLIQSFNLDDVLQTAVNLTTLIAQIIVLSQINSNKDQPTSNQKTVKGSAIRARNIRRRKK